MKPSYPGNLNRGGACPAALRPGVVFAISSLHPVEIPLATWVLLTAEFPRCCGLCYIAQTRAQTSLVVLRGGDNVSSGQNII